MIVAFRHVPLDSAAKCDFIKVTEAKIKRKEGAADEALAVVQGQGPNRRPVLTIDV